jgi:geranyl-CoA carboxylase alpha subunit
VTLDTRSAGHYSVQVGDDCREFELQAFEETRCELACDGARELYQFIEIDDVTLHISDSSHTAVFTDRRRITPDAEEAAGGGTVVAPMHGQLLTMEVQPGDAVTQGQRLAVLEAMKMQHEICAAASGTVLEVAANPGAQVAAGDTLVVLEVED